MIMPLRDILLSVAKGFSSWSWFSPASDP